MGARHTELSFSRIEVVFHAGALIKCTQRLNCAAHEAHWVGIDLFHVDLSGFDERVHHREFKWNR